MVSHCNVNLHFPGGNDVNLFMYALIVLISSLKKIFKSLAYLLKIGLVLFLLSDDLLCILDTNPLSDIRFANIFSQSLVCFQFLNGVLCNTLKRILKFNKSVLTTCAFDIISKKALSNSSS